MKWIGERISFVDEKIKTTIVIEPERNFWINGLMGAWLAMWYAIGVIVIWAIFKLNLKKSIKSYGKSIPFYFENIKNFSLRIPDKNSIQVVWESSPWVNGGERLFFEYFGKEIGFGRKLNDKDAILLYNLVTKRIVERNRK